MIAIVTDSTVCMTRREAKRLAVHIVPQTYHILGQVYTEGFEDENGKFEELLRLYGSTAKTAHANIGSFLSTYETLLEKGFEILVITMSSRLSGAYSAAVMAAREAGGRVRVVDSLTTAGGLLLLIRAAREYERTGKTLDETAAFALEQRDRICTVFSVESMDSLRRSGRIGFVRQSVTTILNIRPVLMCRDGMVVAEGIERGQNALISRMASMIPENAKQALLMDAGNRKKLALLREEIEKKRPGLALGASKIGPVLSIHLGPGVFGVAWMV